MTGNAADLRAHAELLADRMWRLLELERDITTALHNPQTHTGADLVRLRTEYRALSIFVFGAVRPDRQ